MYTGKEMDMSYIVTSMNNLGALGLNLTANFYLVIYPKPKSSANLLSKDMA